MHFRHLLDHSVKHTALTVCFFTSISQFTYIFLNSSHTEHDSSLCGLNCGSCIISTHQSSMALIYQNCIHQISSVHPKPQWLLRFILAETNPMPAQKVVYVSFELVQKCAEKQFLKPHNALTNHGVISIWKWTIPLIRWRGWVTTDQSEVPYTRDRGRVWALVPLLLLAASSWWCSACWR